MKISLNQNKLQKKKTQEKLRFFKNKANPCLNEIIRFTEDNEFLQCANCKRFFCQDENEEQNKSTVNNEQNQINNEDISNDINDIDIFANDEEIEKKKEKKRIIIQNHSKSSDIEEYDKKFYLVNKKEVDITIMLCHSLKKTSKNIAVFTFNKGQFNLIKQKFKNELSFVNVVLFY